MREVICPKCQTDAEIDTADDGNLTCLRCGHIVEETDHLRAEIDLVTSEGGTRACGRYANLYFARQTYMF